VPTYQYACTDCGRDLEVVQKFTDDALTECPSCSGKLRKVFSAVGVVFKGSGFYRTDSRQKSSASTPGSSDKSSDKAASDRAKASSEHSSPVGKDSSSSSSSSSSSDKGSSDKGSSGKKSESAA
jgi:putative FmdB family regulatory protein